MSDPVPPKPAKPARISFGRVVVVGLLAAVAAGGYYLYVLNTEGTVEPVDTSRRLADFARTLQQKERLADGYTDANGDKLADTPGETGKLLQPDEIAFCAVAQDDPDEAEKLWRPLMDALAAATGKPVKYLKEIPGEEGMPAVPLRTTEEQLAALRDGRLHVTAFNTGSVPVAVNTAGFHPLVAPADDDGRFTYQMQVIVAGNSPIGEPAGLKGKTLGLVALSSNSGGRAPLVLLRDKFELHPHRDYDYVFTGSHARAIEDLTGGKVTPSFDAACVASDILQQMIDSQKVDAGRVKVIYSSSSFPKLTFGVPHNLDPDLRAKIAEALLAYRFSGPLAERYKGEKATRFAPVNYAKDFADVLEIDRKLGEYYGTRPQ